MGSLGLSLGVSRADPQAAVPLPLTAATDPGSNALDLELRLALSPDTGASSDGTVRTSDGSDKMLHDARRRTGPGGHTTFSEPLQRSLLGAGTGNLTSQLAGKTPLMQGHKHSLSGQVSPPQVLPPLMLKSPSLGSWITKQNPGGSNADKLSSRGLGDSPVQATLSSGEASEEALLASLTKSTTASRLRIPGGDSSSSPNWQGSKKWGGSQSTGLPPRSGQPGLGPRLALGSSTSDSAQQLGMASEAGVSSGNCTGGTKQSWTGFGWQSPGSGPHQEGFAAFAHGRERSIQHAGSMIALLGSGEKHPVSPATPRHVLPDPAAGTEASGFRLSKEESDGVLASGSGERSGIQGHPSEELQLGPSRAAAASWQTEGSPNFGDEADPGRETKKRRLPPTNTEPQGEGNKESKPNHGSITHRKDKDGHSWRKYSHKVLQGSTCERLYYSCEAKDATGCTARKIVDRPKIRIWRGDSIRDFVTIEGQHNHVPKNTSKGSP